MKKTLAKILAIALCAILLVSGTVYITLAYLQSQSNVVQNTFTVSNIYLSLDESKVNPDGTRDTSTTERVTTNNYKLIPGSPYIKDPIVHVEAGSEPCFIVIAIHETLFSGGGIAEVEYVVKGEGEQLITKGTIATQMGINGWVELTDYHIKDTYLTNDLAGWKEGNAHNYKLYYYNGIAEAGDNLPIFDGFKLGDISQERMAALQAEGAVPPTFDVVAFGMQTTGYGANFDAATSDGAKIGVAFGATFGEKIPASEPGNP